MKERRGEGRRKRKRKRIWKRDTNKEKNATEKGARKTDKGFCK
jgi:hypothetical protein